MARAALRIDFRLEIAGDAFDIPGGAIRSLRFSLESWGFDAEVVFWVDARAAEDKLFAPFQKKDLAKAKLSIERAAKPRGVPATPIVLQGLVTEKEVFEAIDERAEGRPVALRRYTVRFADPAQVLWKQHFPCALLADASLHELLESLAVEGVALRYEWDVFEKKHPVLCVPLGAERNSASFYDFVLWLVRLENGVFEYDSAKNAYYLKKAKSQEGEAAAIPRSQIGGVRIRLPEVRRGAAAVLNSYAEAAKKEEVPQDASVSPVRRDVLLCEPIAAVATARKTLEAARLAQGKPGLDLVLKDFPTVFFRPGAFVKFEAGAHAQTSAHVGKDYRVREVLFSGRAAESSPRKDLERPVLDCDFEMSGVLEEKADPEIPLPPFTAPTWPLWVEGRVLSEQGEPNERTFQFYTDEQTKLDFYKVQVPIFNQKVIVPFDPDHVPGHFFFPAFKNQRVLLRLDWKSARISRFLDWGPGVRLPMPGQGNHILFGLHPKSETSIKHDYTDNKPVLEIKRLNEKDLQRIAVAEGSITLEVKEETATAAAEETYDIKIHVENAKGDLRGKVADGITEIGATFGGCEGEVTGALERASSQVNGALEGAAADISGAVAAALGELQTLKGEMTQEIARLEARAEEAKAALRAATE